jgi:putative sigma-54 modulation protein
MQAADRQEGGLLMQVTVSGKNVDVPDELKSHATRKFSKVERFGQPILTMDVVFSEERNPRVAEQHRVEVTCSTKAHVIRAEAAGTEAEIAVDRALERLERQVKKLKERRKGHAKGSGHKPLAEPADLTPLDEAEADDRGPVIVRFKRVLAKPMTAEEAVTTMDLLGHDFYLFSNSETDRLSVVYRRRNGNFGLIEPEA